MYTTHRLYKTTLEFWVNFVIQEEEPRFLGSSAYCIKNGKDTVIYGKVREHKEGIRKIVRFFVSGVFISVMKLGKVEKKIG